jgi:hypothetical protein
LLDFSPLNEVEKIEGTAGWFAGSFQRGADEDKLFVHRETVSEESSVLRIRRGKNALFFARCWIKEVNCPAVILIAMMLLEVTIGMTKLAFSFEIVASIFPQWESRQSPKFISSNRSGRIGEWLLGRRHAAVVFQL